MEWANTTGVHKGKQLDEREENINGAKRECIKRKNKFFCHDHSFVSTF